MAASIVSLSPRRQSQDWCNDEVAEFARAQDWLVRAGFVVDVEQGRSDEGDPWLAFCLAASGDIIVHFARIRGEYFISAPALCRALHGRDFRKLIGGFLQEYPLADNRRFAGVVALHPKSVLFGLILVCVARMTLHSEARAAEAIAARKHSAALISPSDSDGQSTKATTLSVPRPEPIRAVFDHANNIAFVEANVFCSVFAQKHIAPASFNSAGLIASWLPPPELREMHGSRAAGQSMAFAGDFLPFDVDNGGTTATVGLPQIATFRLLSIVPTATSFEVGLRDPFFAAEPPLLSNAGKLPIWQISSGALADPIPFQSKTDLFLTTSSGANSEIASQSGTNTLDLEASATNSATVATVAVAAGTPATSSTGSSDTALDQAALLVANLVANAASHVAAYPSAVFAQINSILANANVHLPALPSALQLISPPDSSAHDASTSNSIAPANPTSVAANGTLMVVPTPVTPSQQATISTNINQDIAQYISFHTDYQILKISHETILFDPGDLANAGLTPPPVEAFTFQDGSVIALIGVVPHQTVTTS